VGRIVTTRQRKQRAVAQPGSKEDLRRRCLQRVRLVERTLRAEAYVRRQVELDTLSRAYRLLGRLDAILGAPWAQPKSGTDAEDDGGK
jgi:hypothetical protein